MKRRVLSVILASTIAICLSACGGTAETSSTSEAAAPAAEEKESVPAAEEKESAPATEGKTFKVGLSMPNIDAYSQRVVDAWQAACDSYGMEFMYSDGESSVEKQVSQVEDMVAAGCDFVSVFASDPDGLAQAAEYCASNGVAIAGCEHDINSDACITHFVFPETGVGEGAGLAVAQLLDEKPDLQLKMGHIWVLSSIAPEQQRWEGFTRVLKDYIDSGRLEIVDEQQSQNDSAAAMTIAENWLTSMPEMNAIFGNNDAMAYSAAGIVASNGKKMNEEFYVFGIGGDPDGISGIQENIMYSTSISADMDERQAHWVDIIYDYLANGTELEDSYIWNTPATPVTPHNIDDYKDW